MDGMDGMDGHGRGPFVFSRRAAVVDATGDVGQEEAVTAAVNRFALRPLGRDEFAVFTLDLCHNEIDRRFSRFPEEELVTINEMVVGRPLMERHDVQGTLPRGTFFRSRLVRDGARVSVRPDVYVLRTSENADFILNIEGGVYRDTSIGFSFELPECSICGKDLRTCDHVPGREYKGNLCHYVMRQVVDVIEGSVVASGSQGTQFVSAERALERAREEGRTQISNLKSQISDLRTQSSELRTQSSELRTQISDLKIQSADAAAGAVRMRVRRGRLMRARNRRTGLSGRP